MAVIPPGSPDPLPTATMRRSYAPLRGGPLQASNVKMFFRLLSFDTRFGNARLAEGWLGRGARIASLVPLWELRTIAIVSSHPKRGHFESPRWVSRLLDAIAQAKEEERTILYASETPYAAVIRHACRRLEALSLELHTTSRESDALKKAAQLDANQGVVWIQEKDSVEKGVLPLPQQDRSVIALADLVSGIEITPHGKISQLLEHRTTERSIPPSTVRIPSGSKNDLYWLKRGACLWQNDFIDKPSKTDRQETITQVHPVVYFSNDTKNEVPGELLIHCTRGRTGAWPGQSEEEYLRELIDNIGLTPRRPLDVLLKILETKVLLATKDRKPGNRPTVSFSASGLQELLDRRAYQRHLAHWDWEPYGIAVSKEFLEALGARPVRYRRKEELATIPEEEKLFTQVYSDTGAGRDWREEKEWRLPGDLSLADIPSSHAIVFVPTVEEKEIVQQLSHWPVIVP